MTSKRSLLAAVAATLTIPLGLAGCSGGMSDSELTTTLESALVPALVHVTGAHVGLAYSGPENRTVIVNLYVDSDDSAILSTATDAAFKTVWKMMPSMPVSISVSATLGPKPVDAENYEPRSLDPSTVASNLDISVKYVINGHIKLNNVVLAERYGQWQAPASK